MLIEEYRGSVLENTHNGSICVTDEASNVLHSVGDINAITYYRSASKPFQALPLFMRGIHKKYSLTDEEMTIFASSHIAERAHIDVLESILKKTELNENDLIMLPTFPADTEHRNFLIRENKPPRKLYHNCSGKHIALMLLERELAGTHENYWRIESQAQQEVLRVISLVSDIPKPQILCGTDGCGVPVFAVPLCKISTAFMKLANPHTVNDYDLQAALSLMAECINKHPYMVRGHNYICSEINTVGTIVAKGGAQGIYGLGIKNKGLGIALKVADGSMHTWELIILEVLRQLGFADSGITSVLNQLCSTVIKNDNKEDVGYYRTVFKLT